MTRITRVVPAFADDAAVISGAQALWRQVDGEISKRTFAPRAAWIA